MSPWPTEFPTSTVDQVAQATPTAPPGTTPTAYDGVAQIYVAQPDGSNRTCISCSPPPGAGAPAPSQFKLMPAMRSQNDWLVLSGEMSAHPAYPTDPSAAHQEIQNGFWADLWVTNPAGSAWYNLTQYTVPPDGSLTGVLAPTFSPDGSRIAWSRPVANADQNHPMGYWQLWLADFSLTGGVPTLHNARNVSGPGGTWFEPESWSPDSSTLLVSSDMGVPYQYGMDLFPLNVATGQFGPDLTNSPLQWDEQANYSRSGKKVLWMSTSPNPPLMPQDATMMSYQILPLLQIEFWIMGADGALPERITGFDTPLPAGVPDPEYSPGVNNLVYGGVWNLDGTQVIVPQGVLNPLTLSVTVTHKWLITFAGRCG